MMNAEAGPFRSQTLRLGLASAVLMVTAAAASAQRLPGTENGEWRYLGVERGYDPDTLRTDDLDHARAWLTAFPFGSH